MAYSDLNQNQTISFNNLQSAVSQGVFTAKTTIPSGTKQVTKAQANTYVNINTSLQTFAAKASNQLITKQDLSGITTVSPYLMYGIADTSVYKSIDGGATWTAFTSLPSLNWTAVAGDITGTYIIALVTSISDVIYRSNDGGNTFYTILIDSDGDFKPTDVSMSNNGQYVSVVGATQGELNRARIVTSSNFGVSYTTEFSYTDDEFLDIDLDFTSSGKQNGVKVAVSGNGQYITVIVSYNVDPGFPNAPRPWSYKIISNNYGSTWTKTGKSEFFRFGDIALSFTGQHQLITSDYSKPGFLGDIGIAAYVSNNYGANWSVQYANTTNYFLGGRHHDDFSSATVSDDGQVMIGCATNNYVGNTNPLPPIVIRSINYGVTFTQKDGFYNNIGIAASNQTTGGITNGYVSMPLSNIAQFNYSVDAGNTFVPKVSVSRPWKRLYRKAFVYNPSSNPAYGTYLYSECSACDLYAIRADGNGRTYYAEVMQYNSESCCFGGGGGEV